MATKYPIILVHGIMLKDLGAIRAFGKIESVLQQEGHAVFTADHDGLGSIENNAEQLKEYIQGVLSATGAEKVNLIAHSKGGLDSLYMIEKLDMRERIASLTFLSTPHRGSIIADKLYTLPHIIRGTIAFFMNFWYRIFGDKHPDALEVCRQLRTSDKNVHNLEHIAAHDGVYMQSYSTTIQRGRDDFLMGIPFIISRYFENLPTDGMVSAESSKYANYRGNCTNIPVSHSEIVDFMARKSKKEKIYGFYTELCRELSEMGF
jgi:triacylglycerol lipase